MLTFSIALIVEGTMLQKVFQHIAYLPPRMAIDGLTYNSSVVEHWVSPYFTYIPYLYQ